MQATLGERLLEGRQWWRRNAEPHFGDTLARSELDEETFFALETLLLSRLPQRARILDICCGQGRLSEFLVRCGFRVTCVDASPEMIQKSRKRVKSARFFCGDIRQLALSRDFHAVVCSNEPGAIWRPDELVAVFGTAYQLLLRGGFFCFETQTKDAFRQARPQVTTVNGDLGFPAGDGQAAAGAANVMPFHLAAAHTNMPARRLCYDAKEMELSLNMAGFRETHCYHAEDLGIRRSCAAGRLFFLGCKRYCFSLHNTEPMADAA